MRPFLAAILLTLGVNAFADVGGPTVIAGGGPTMDVNTPPALTRIADGLHVLDNGTPSTFYDVSRGVWQAGIITEIYRQYYLSVDLGGAADMTADASLEFLTGARLHAGELAYDRLPWLKTFVDANNLRSGLFKYTAAGLYVSRNWSAPHTSWGPYAGIEYRFR